MPRPTLLLAALGLLAAPSFAQVRAAGVPASEYLLLEEDVPATVLTPPDVAAYEREDAERGHRPFRYGAVLEAALDCASSGTWSVVDDPGLLVWRARLVAPGAYTLGLVFDRFDLPEGGQLFLMSADRTEVLGAYTSANHQPNGMFGVEPVTGDTVLVEYVQPLAQAELPSLRVGQVIYDYRNLRDDRLWAAATGGADGSCLIDINCPQGDEYQVVKRSVVRTLSGGALCSGAILNNTAVDGTPYMLTANHCGNMTNGVFTFNYERSGCGTGSVLDAKAMSGATLLANTSFQDSQLYELNNPIPPDIDVYYAGWDRSTSTSAPAATIGHGGGDPKQIAIDNTGAVTSGNFWSVFWDEGMMIGGNSGGPLFNGFQRVIGPACCVNQFVCGAQSGSFGRFDRFWSNQGLAQWLDPLGTGQLALDGFDPDQPVNAPAISSVQPAVVAALGSGEVLTIQGSNFFGVTSVQLGGKTLVPGQFTQVDGGELEVESLLFEELGSVPVTVTNSVGTSNAVSITVTEVPEPLLVAPQISLPGFPLSIQWAGPIGDFYHLTWALDGTTVPFAGADVLASSFVGLTGFLSQAGTEELFTPSAPSFGFITLFFQVRSFDESTFAFTGATNVAALLLL